MNIKFWSLNLKARNLDIERKFKTEFPNTSNDWSQHSAEGNLIAVIKLKTDLATGVRLQHKILHSAQCEMSLKLNTVMCCHRQLLTYDINRDVTMQITCLFIRRQVIDTYSGTVNKHHMAFLRSPLTQT